MHERFLQLWTDWLEGELDEAGLAELQRLLADDEQLLRLAADLYEEHRLLGLAHTAMDRDAFVRVTLERLRGNREQFVSAVAGRLPRATPRRARAWFLPSTLWRYGLVAAATLCVSLAGQWLLLPHRPEVSASVPAIPQVPAERVATLVRTHQAEWAAGEQRLEGQRLSPGTLHLLKGLALVAFDSGARMMLTGPAELEVQSRLGAYLRQGRATVRAGEEAVGFTLRTSTRDIIDLGTEFAAIVEPSGHTEIHVLEGLVEWTPSYSLEEGQLVQGGEAVRFARPEAANGERVPLRGPRFQELVRRMERDGQGLLAYEGFAYPPGRRRPAEANGGRGWTGPWRVRQGEEIRGNPDAASEMLLSREPLSGPRLPSPSQGAVLEMPAGASYYLRQLATPLDLGRDAVYYVSFLQREAARQPITRPVIPLPFCRLTFRPSADYQSESIGVGLPPFLRPQIYAGHAGTITAPKTIAAGPTCLWVVKIVASKNGADEIFLKIYRPEDAVEALEPPVWTLSSGGFSSDARFDLLVLTGTGPGKHWLDEIRMGTTWDAVTTALEADR